MKRISRHKIRGFFCPHKKLNHLSIPWTPVAAGLYDLIYSFGVRGCWMSSDTLAGRLNCCRRTIIYTRQFLVRHAVIIAARSKPCTWSMWSSHHPAVRKTQTLYFKGDNMDNPVYVLACARGSTVQNLHVNGATAAPNQEQNKNPLPGVRSYSQDDPKKPVHPAPGKEPAPPWEKFTQGDTPPGPPGRKGKEAGYARGGSGKAQYKHCRYQYRKNNALKIRGLTKKHGVDVALAIIDTEFDEIWYADHKR